MAIGSEEGKLLIYDATSMKKLKELTVYQSALWSLVFDTHKYLYTVGNDPSILRWDLGTYKSTAVINTGAIVNSLSINNKDGVMAAGLANGEVLLLKISDSVATQIGKVQSRVILSCFQEISIFHPGGKLAFRRDMILFKKALLLLSLDLKEIC